jgi:hypothetical protein
VALRPLGPFGVAPFRLAAGRALLGLRGAGAQLFFAPLVTTWPLAPKQSLSDAFIPPQFGFGHGRARHQNTKTSQPMRLLSSDLFRNFSIGFVLGAVLVFGANPDGWSASLSSPARAASMPEVVQPTAEFVIPVEASL